MDRLFVLTSAVFTVRRLHLDRTVHLQQKERGNALAGLMIPTHGIPTATKFLYIYTRSLSVFLFFTRARFVLSYMRAARKYGEKKAKYTRELREPSRKPVARGGIHRGENISPVCRERRKYRYLSGVCALVLRVTSAPLKHHQRSPRASSAVDSSRLSGYARGGGAVDTGARWNA